MPRITHWSQLAVGLAALGGAIALAAGVLVFARVGALHGPATTLYLATSRANRVIQGTEVWLGGQKVGVVDEVSFRPATVDTTERVLIRMRVLNQYMPYVRRNSDVQLRAGTTLIGAPVVFITIGTRAAQPVRALDTLRGLAQYESQPASVVLSSIGDSVVAIASAMREIRAQLDTTGRAIGAVRRSSTRGVGEVTRALATFERRALRSRGSVALAVNDAGLRREVARLGALTDSLRAAAAAPHGVGRFARDSTLVLRIRETRATVQELQGRLRRYTGVPVQGDSALARELARTRRVLDSLVSDAKRHPFRYLPF